MKKLKQFFKDWWKALGDPINLEGEPQEEPYPYWKLPKDISCQCPFCGYQGSKEEMRCHLLNDHEEKI